MNPIIVERINQINTKRDFDTYIERVKMSSAPIALREDIIKEAQKKHPKFHLMDASVKIKALRMIEESRADISDVDGHSA